MSSVAPVGSSTVPVQQSEAFARWFEGSVVVDQRGQPLKVFHGSRRAGFVRFDADRSGENSGRPLVGIYFTNHREAAATYSNTKKIIAPIEDPEFDARYDGEPGNYEVYLSLRNPHVIDFGEQGWDSEVDGFNDLDDVARYALEAGHDGVIARNVIDEGHYGHGYGWGDTTYIVFDPRQIKSATHNRGTFDPADDSILNEDATVPAGGAVDAAWLLAHPTLPARTCRVFVRAVVEAMPTGTRALMLRNLCVDVHGADAAPLEFDARWAVTLRRELIEFARRHACDHLVWPREADPGISTLMQIVCLRPDGVLLAARSVEQAAQGRFAIAQAVEPSMLPALLGPALAQQLQKCPATPQGFRTLSGALKVPARAVLHLGQLEGLLNSTDAPGIAADALPAPIAIRVPTAGGQTLDRVMPDAGAAEDYQQQLDADGIRSFRASPRPPMPICRLDVSRAAAAAKPETWTPDHDQSRSPSDHAAPAVRGRPAVADRRSDQPDDPVRGAANADARGSDQRGAGGRGRRFTGFALAGRIAPAEPTALIGAAVPTTADLARMAQVYRDPRREVFRMFFVRDGHIVHATAVSSRMVNHTRLMPSDMDQDSFIRQIRQTIERTGANKLVWLHNHPTGIPTPSRADLHSTATYAELIPELSEHIVINSHRYAVIDRAGEYQIHEADFGPDKLLDPAMPHPMLGQLASSALEVARLAKSAQRPGWVQLIGVSTHGHVRAIMDVSSGLLGGPLRRIEATIDRMARASGSASVLVYGEAQDLPVHRCVDLIQRGFLGNVVYGAGESFRTRFRLRTADHMLFGRDERQIATHRLLGKAHDQWFAGSAFAAADGTPIAVHRGEGSRRLHDRFDRRETREEAFFFTTDRPTAEMYGLGAAVRTYHLRAERVLDLWSMPPAAESFVREWASQFDEWIDPRSGEPVDPVDVVQSGRLFEYDGWEATRWRSLQRAIANNGYDGAWLPDTGEEGRLIPVAIVFRPEQIKAVDDNAGTYLRDDPNVLRETNAVRVPTRPTSPTAGFARWFEGSAVVDNDGNPQVVYHGSRAPWISSFDLQRAGTGVVMSGTANAAPVIWFSSSRDNAAWFADPSPKRSADPDSVMAYGDDGQCYAAVFDRKGASIFEVGPYATRSRALSHASEEVAWYNRALRQDTFVQPVYLALRKALVVEDEIPTRAMIDQARAQGYDGVIARGVTDGVIHGDVFVAFSPSQVKSAIRNSGAFDPSDHSILREEGIAAAASPGWVCDDHGRPAVCFHGTGTTFEQFAGAPVWFSRGSDLANEYAAFRWDGSPRVIPAYLRASRPFDADCLPHTVTIGQMFTEIVKQAGIGAQDPRLSTLNEHRLAMKQLAMQEESGPHYSRHDFWYPYCFGQEGRQRFIESLRCAGFDSVRMTELGHVTYGVLDPEQIVSAYQAPAPAPAAVILPSRRNRP